jgi:ParB family chromosome partitioning protein
MGKREELAKLQREKCLINNTNNPNAIDMFIDDLGNKKDELINVKLNQLRAYHNHIFKLYEGDRLDEMVRSVIDNGIITPIIIRPIEHEEYPFEILAGHNRFRASTIAGLCEIPSVVKYNLTDEEAELITITTNLNQRAIESMLPSELGFALRRQNELLKRQGKRTDLDTLVPMGLKFTADKIGDEYKLSATNVKRYIRLTYLSNELLQMVDDNKITFRAGVEISFLKELEQSQLQELIQQGYNVSVKIAEELKKQSQESDDVIKVKSIIDELMGNTNSTEKIKFNKSTKDKIRKIIPSDDMGKINEIIIEALEYYYKSKEAIV